MGYPIEVVELKPQPVLVMAAEVPPQELGAALARILPTVHGHVMNNGGGMTGMPFMRYLDMTDRFSIQAGVPVAEPMESSGEILAGELPGGRAATTVFLGPYDQVGLAWDAMRAWCAERNIDAHWGGWDVYENDPSEVSDPGELRTRIYQPLG